MILALGADHRGYNFKELVKGLLATESHTVHDFGTYAPESADYPEYGIKAAEAVARGDADFGIIVCGTGNGMAMAANKVRGIRAALVLNVEMARLARAHNDANVLVLSDMFTPEGQIADIVKTFLDTSFEGGRHARRIARIKDYERG